MAFKVWDGFNQKLSMVESREATAVSIDTCNDAVGEIYKGDCVYTSWNQAPRSVRLLPTNYEEDMSLELASMWANQGVFVHSDNSSHREEVEVK